MTLLSKNLTAKCCDFKHPWNSSCINEFILTSIDGLKYSFKLYLIFYLVGLIIKRKKPTKEIIISTIKKIIRSTIYLGFTSSLCLGGICLFRYILGSVNIYTAASVATVPGMLLTYSIESNVRMQQITLYVINNAAQSLYNMGIKYNKLPIIKNGIVYLFMIASAVLSYIYRSSNSNDGIISALRYVVGANEGFKSYDDKLSNKNSNHYTKFEKTKCCPHPNNCISYVFNNSLKNLIQGFGLQFTLTLLFNIKKLFKNPQTFINLLFTRNSLKLGTFAFLYSTIFKTVCCSLRKLRGKDSNSYGLLAGLFAGSSFSLIPNNTVANYSFWKGIELLYVHGLSNNILPNIPHALRIINSTSFAILFHTFLFENDCLPSSYAKMMHKVSGGRLTKMVHSYEPFFGKNGADFFLLNKL